LEFNVPFQHKYGYIRDELVQRVIYQLHELSLGTRITGSDVHSLSLEMKKAEINIVTIFYTLISMLNLS